MNDESRTEDAPEEQAEPTEADAAEVDAAGVDAAETDAIEADAAEADAAETEPAETEPAETEPAEADATESESVEAAPAPPIESDAQAKEGGSPFSNEFRIAEKDQEAQREAAARAAFYAIESDVEPSPMSVGAQPQTTTPEESPPLEGAARPSDEPDEEPKKAASGAEDDEEPEVEEEPLIVEPPDDGIKRRWFAIHAHSGQEGNVKRNLIVQAEQDGLSNLVTNILVPMEQVEEFKTGGEKKVSKRKFFPGYVLIQLPEHPERNPELWHLIKDTPGVTGFIGSRNTPVPLEDSEVQAIVEEIRGERERPKQKVAFEVSERVKITDGPFANFLGNIDEINEERGKLKVLVEIFERQTSVEVDYWQVEKI